jgi:hypothetical protein
MERDSAKHGPRHDDALLKELSGQLGTTPGSNREEWAEPEPWPDEDEQRPETD